jgi:hypothetical protein
MNVPIVVAISLLCIRASPPRNLTETMQFLVTEHSNEERALDTTYESSVLWGWGWKIRVCSCLEKGPFFDSKRQRCNSGDLSSLASWITPTIQEKKIALVQPSWALHKYASEQCILNWCYIQNAGLFRSFLQLTVRLFAPQQVPRWEFQCQNREWLGIWPWLWL